MVASFLVLGPSSPAAFATGDVTYSDGVTLSNCSLHAGYQGYFQCTITAPSGQPGPTTLGMSAYYSFDGIAPNGYGTSSHVDGIYGAGSFTDTRSWCQAGCGYGETTYIVGACVAASLNGQTYFAQPFGNVPSNLCHATYKNYDGSASNPTVSLTATPDTTDSNAPNATLTASASKPLAPPYQISIYDSQNNLIVCGDSGSAVSTTVAPATNETASYTAFVAQDCPTSSLPLVDVRSQSSATVENVGWIGSLTLTSNGSAPTATLTATLGLPLVAPYRLSIYDDSGQQLFCNASSVTSGQVSVTPPLTSTRTYEAYVAQDCPSSSAPVSDVRVSASLRYVAGVLTAQLQGGVSLDDLATLLSRLSDDQIDALLLLAPGTRLLRGSLTDQQLEYDAARAAGNSIKQALIRAVAVAGTASAWTVWLWVNAEPTAPPAPAPPVPGSNPSPQSSKVGPDPAGAVPSYEDYLTSRILGQKTTLSVEKARNAARNCLALVNWALANGSLTQPAGGKNPCDSKNIFFMGSNSPLSTSHAWDAITGLGSGAFNPSWIQLNYVSSSDRASSGLARGWYSGNLACAGVVAGITSCDEYPFYSSAQSGPGASLRVIDSRDNSAAGGSYGAFVVKCQLTSGGPVAATQVTNGTPFLVIPMNFDDAPRSFSLCAGS